MQTVPKKKIFCCTHRAVDQKNLESFELWYWRRMEKISWTDHMRNEDVLLKSEGAEEYPT
jgi:hypothetical protein